MLTVSTLTISQIVLDYFQYNLNLNTSFLKKGGDGARKSTSSIQLVVNFAKHFCDEQVGGHDLRSAVEACTPEPDSDKFVTWNVARNEAAKKIGDAAMKAMLRIEEYVNEQQKKNDGGPPS